MSIFVCFIDAFDNKLVERFLGIVKLTTFKKAVDLHEIIMKHPESKNFDLFCLCFSGLDGTNTTSGDQKGLQCLICQTASHSQYLSCRNHRLALYLVHLIPRYGKLLGLDGVLLLLRKIFKYSCIKQAIFEQAQETSNLKPLNILKACTARWLTQWIMCNNHFKVPPLNWCIRFDFLWKRRCWGKRSQRSASWTKFVAVTISGRSFKSDQYIIKVSSNEHSSVHLDHLKC